MKRREFSLAVLLGFSAGGCAGNSGHAPASRQKMAHYTRVLKKHPERYPVRVSLAEACLAEARRTLDPAWVSRARAELHRSLETQESFEAFLAFARLENFAHRFQDGLRWAHRAATASVSGQPTPDIRLLQFEALLGLGRANEAAAMLPPEGEGEARFERASGRARLLALDGRRRAAADAFARAAALASTNGRPDLAGWALVQQAGCLLDEGATEAARPCLRAAEALVPGDPALAIHWAEYHEALGHWARAMGIYQTALARAEHPLSAQRAWRCALKLSRESEARRQFLAAEAGYRRAIDAGEVYTLGALARLYTEAGVRLPEALRLARLNLHHVRDAEAHQTLRRVELLLR